MNTGSGKTESKGQIELPAYPTLFNKALERVAEVGKTSLDLAVEQNTEILASYRNMFRASPMPGLFLFDLLGQVLEDYTVLQKSLLDLAVEQSTSVLEVVQGCRRDGREEKADCQRDPAIDCISEIDSTADDTNQLRADTLLAKKVVDLFVMQQPSRATGTRKETQRVTGPLKITDDN